MTLREKGSLRFNTPVLSTIDGSTWFYDCDLGDGVQLYKVLVDNDSNEWLNRRHFNQRPPWERRDVIHVNLSMFLEDFKLVDKMVKWDIELVKKIKYLVQPHSITKGNPHMTVGLPF